MQFMGIVSLMLLTSHKITRSTVRLTYVLSSHNEQLHCHHVCHFECGHMDGLVDSGGCGLEFSVLKSRMLKILVSLERNTS